MKLEELLDYNDIVIQCHNDPDADAVASGYGVYCYLESKGKKPRLVYGGDTVIQKSNMVLMCKLLEIPIKHVETLPEPELLVCVDGQYGTDSVAYFPAQTVAVIDHHKQEVELPKLHELRDSYGACATIVWDLLTKAGFPVQDNTKLATALYYGLFMDTGKLQELGHPKDKDLRDELEFRCEKGIMHRLLNCNLSGEELRIAGRALAQCEYFPEYRFAMAQAEFCDPNILGLISDMILETDIVDTCVAYSMLDGFAKLSVRSCIRETKATELVQCLTEGFGGGGGHLQKAAGRMFYAPLKKTYGEQSVEELGSVVRSIIEERATSYFQNQVIIHAGTSEVPDLSQEPLYQKLRLPIGYVKATDLYPEGTEICVRMLEGDFTFNVKLDTYLMFGVASDVYKNDEAYFLSHNDFDDTPYLFREEYAPTVRKNISSPSGLKAQPLEGHVKTCVPKGGSLIHAQEIKSGRIKVFQSWDKENYMLGLPGDWLVTRADDPQDCYIIRRDIFFQSYAPYQQEDGQ